ncbi:MAG: hypothetical protein GVY36_05940 [Verrucomicrobia bacterium]|jgi:hypothetical protein|nr:hypothetical protein [Verrucomicrobiota bacterium]
MEDLMKLDQDLRGSGLENEAQLRKLNNLLVRTLGGAHGAGPLGLARPEDLSVCLIDSTCLKADIHFPVDWVLLRDVSITLLKAVVLIRKDGLLHRMPEEPEQLMREMNKLSIVGTGSSYAAGTRRPHGSGG